MSADNLPPFTDYDAVRVLDQPDPLILVGEHHGSSESATLVQNVLAQFEPTLVAIESSPMQQAWGSADSINVSAGADVAVDYARRTATQVGLIDKSQLDILTDITLVQPEPSPCDPPEPQANGDIAHDEINYYRDQIRTQCPQRYTHLLVERERYMTGYVKTLTQSTSGPLVVIVGAGHLPAIADHVQNDSIPALDVPDERLLSME